MSTPGCVGTKSALRGTEDLSSEEGLRWAEKSLELEPAVVSSWAMPGPPQERSRKTLQTGLPLSQNERQGGSNMAEPPSPMLPQAMINSANPPWLHLAVAATVHTQEEEQSTRGHTARA